jgi:hypothetical protein
MQNLTASLDGLGAGRYRGSIHARRPLNAGAAWANPAQFALHFPSWQGWNAQFAGLEVLDSLSNRIYGNAPVWPAAADPEMAKNPSSSSTVSPSSAGLGISRAPEGLVVTVPVSTYLKLFLVDAFGTPKWSIFEGTLSAGGGIVPLDWNSVDISQTWLVAQADGQIVSNTLLASLPISE